MCNQVKVICIKCSNPLTTINVETPKGLVVKAFCYPCENDAFAEGVEITSKQWQRSLK